MSVLTNWRKGFGGTCARRTFKANCRPSKTARLKGSFSTFNSALARFRAASRSSRTIASRPFLRLVVTKKSGKGQSGYQSMSSKTFRRVEDVPLFGVKM